VLYIIAILLFILVLAIPAARNILFALLTGALGLSLLGLALAGLSLLGWLLWSYDLKALIALTVETPTAFLKDIPYADILLVLVFIVVAAYILYDYRRLNR
jgi:hypothetical protein